MLQQDMFLLSVLAGAWLAAIYDCIRGIRRCVRHNTFFVAFEDICFWFYCAGVVTDMIYDYNAGELRGYILLGLLIGALIFIMSVGRIFLRLTELIIIFIKKCKKD